MVKMLNASSEPENESTQSSFENGEKQAGKRKVRSRSGCLNCKRKRRKCDEVRPVCALCRRKGEKCDWVMRVTFRSENAQGIVNSHPSMQRKKLGQRPAKFEIKDVTDEVIRDYHQFSPTDEGLPFSQSGNRAESESNRHLNVLDVSRSPDSTDAWDPSTERVPHSGDALHSYDVHQVVSPHCHQTQTPPVLAPSTDPAPSIGQLHVGPFWQESTADPTVASLLQRAETQFSETESTTIPIPLSTTEDTDHLWSPSFYEDSIFLPGSAYLDLHSTLRSHLMHETRSAGPTRLITPDTCGEEGWATTEPGSSSARSAHIPVAAITLAGELDPAQSPLELSREEEYKLWKNWLDEVAPWLDKFDSERHFQHTLPVMARSHAHLRYAILAVSARQLERKERNRQTERSLNLYQIAIHLVLPQLHTRSTAVIASCVVLCVLEMLSSSPKAWRQHLDGCAHLIEAVRIDGFSGGVDQALFWCFARMDVCGGLIASMKTLVPVEQWASNIDLDADIDLFRTRTHFDTYACHAVYLCAQVLNLLAYRPHLASRLGGSDANTNGSYANRWLKLWRYIDDWRANRPEEMLPVTSFAPLTRPFPMVLYSNPAAISGNQLYHTASVLMLQHKPSSLVVSPKPRSIFWHARQICAISMSNDHHGAWTNSIQPLWIAGQWMSHPSEQKAILELFERIEKETGWGTKWRAEDLREFWGGLEDA